MIHLEVVLLSQPYVLRIGAELQVHLLTLNQRYTLATLTVFTYLVVVLA